MKQETVTISGKAVTIGFCYATEIAYRDYTGEDIATYMNEAFAATQGQQQPDVKKSIFLILAAALAYYGSIGDEPPVKDADIMNEATPVELLGAVGAIMKMYVEFYSLPQDEPKDKEKKGGRKKN